MSSKSGQPVINVVQVWGNRVRVGILIEYFLLFVASQLAQRPDERVHAIRRLRDRGHVIAHLVFESSEGADMVNTVLLIERCNGFGADQFAARGVYGRLMRSYPISTRINHV